jgi:hypothetical protein
MTAAADRAIDYNESRPDVEELQNFPDEDGTVYGRARIAGRRRIGHCVWRKMFDWEGAIKNGKGELGRCRQKPVASAPRGSGPKRFG